MLPFLLALPFVGAALCALLSLTGMPRQTPWVITMLTTGFALLVLTFSIGITPAEPAIAYHVPWVPEIGLNFSLWLDGPALFFAWIVIGLGFLIFLYAGFYMDPEDSPWRFFGTMLFFMGAMLGVVLSKNLLLMFIFWELTSISSFILIGHWHEKASARQGAVRALVVTGSGGLCLLAGIALLLFKAMGAGLPLESALEWDVLWENRQLFQAEFAVMLLLLLGAFTKSAQFPFHFWLPGAMEAPTPVSAFLHAATMVKAGIYLLGRLYPIFSDEFLWLAIVGTVGVLTMIVGGFMAIMARDLKQLLAHSTVSQLGLLTAYYGFGHAMIGTDKPLPMDLLLVASHAFFKGALFMLVGVIDHGTHTRDWTKLGGLIRTMPVTGVLVIAGCASMAGLPLTFGFVAKELFLHKALLLKTDVALLKYGLPALAVLASFFTAAYCYRVAISPFFGKPRDPHIHPHEGGLGLLFSPGLLIGLCVLGAWVPFLEAPLAPMINSAFYDTKSGFTLAFFHHVDALLAIAVLIFTAGAVVFLFGERIEAIYTKAGSPAIFRDSFDKLFDGLIPAGAKWLAHTVQSPSLSRNAMIVLGVVFGGVAIGMIAGGLSPAIQLTFTPLTILMVGVLIVTAACLWVVLMHPNLLYKLVALSPVGLFVALFFVLYKSPDLALTQLMVEVVTLLVFLILLWRLPAFARREVTGISTPLRFAIAITVGLVVGLLGLTGHQSPWRSQRVLDGWPSVKDYYVENTKYPAMAASLAEGRELAAARVALEGYPAANPARSGGGNNAVNVILVDFRAIDTLGEILVLGIAGLGVFVMLTQNRRRSLQRSGSAVAGSEEPFAAGRPIVGGPAWSGPSLILSEIGRLTPAAMLVFGAVIFWVGHNEPGGGFIAGLMASVALAFLFLSFKPGRVQKLHTERYIYLIPVGMLLAIATGLSAVAFEAPFLTSAFVYIKSHVFGTTGLSTALGFDLGVFLVVVGMTMLIIEKFRSEAS